MNPPSGERPRAVHQPVMPREVVRSLDLKPGQTVVDGTLGAAGHSRLIQDRIQPDGILIGIDRDPMMLELASKQLDPETSRLVNDSYANLNTILADLGIESVDRIVVDLGLSSDQLADRNRGFGFQAGGELDLRFNPAEGIPASQLVAESSADELAEIFESFGDERHARRIAAQIKSVQNRHPVRTAEDLASIVESSVPGRSAHRHPATRVFQALRIAVNSELEHVEKAVTGTFPDALVDGGTLVVLTFHSIEDRIVKNAFREASTWQTINPKPITATSSETKLNPRARSAKLRAAKRKSR